MKLMPLSTTEFKICSAPASIGRPTLVTLGAPIKSYTLFERLSYWIQLPLVRLFGPVGFIGTGIRAL
jgi:hypothetical protein